MLRRRNAALGASTAIRGALLVVFGTATVAVAGGRCKSRRDCSLNGQCDAVSGQD